MRIILDGIIFSLQPHGGISVYFRELLNYLAFSAVPTLLTLENPIVQNLRELPPKILVNLNNARIFERYRSARIDDTGSVFHSTYYRQPYCSKIPVVVTVHDFTYEYFRNGPSRWIHTHQKYAAIRNAQSIICISESTKDDLLKFVGLRSGQVIHVIPNGVGVSFGPLGIKPAGRPYILFVGERSGYKNFSLVLAALEFLPDFELHCVGGGKLRDEEFINTNPILRSRVLHLGFVTDQILNHEYNQAICLVYPSRYEGFGIPVVEAMKAGCPVVSSKCKAVIEIGGDALEQLEDENPRSLAEAVLRLCEHDYRAIRIKKGLKRSLIYDWQRCHEQTLEVYRKLSA